MNNLYHADTSDAISLSVKIPVLQVSYLFLHTFLIL